jgi:multimeric flavodoxin WrbA
MRTHIILGSSRPRGNTFAAVEFLRRGLGGSLTDLSAHSISTFDHQHRNSEDDFINIAETLCESTHLIFATPVYWYAMSAQLKVFFDRLSDLITIRKPIGRALKGKRTFLVATGSDQELPEGFEVPFRRTSGYFEMIYSGCTYLSFKDAHDLDEAMISQLTRFQSLIRTAG